VGDNATLVTLDLLRLDGTDTVTALADGVADLRVRYGVDTNDDGRVDEWQSPASADWSAANLQDGSEDARQRITRIVALRLAVLTRSSAPERDAVSPASLTLFPDLATALQVSRTLSADEQRQHWRVIDFTVPVRNTLLLAP
jgi:type IV pilus assembly protein PilW